MNRRAMFPNGVKNEYDTVKNENKSMHNMIEQIRIRNEEHEARKHKEQLE